MNNVISSAPSARRLNLLSGHLLVPNDAASKAAAPAKTAAPRAPKGNFKDCWNHLGMDEYMSDKAKKMKA